MTNENAVKGMSIKKKALIVLCALVSVVVIVATSVLATVALLTSSATVTNTFTIGNVGIMLKESKVDLEGKLVDGGVTKVDANVYKLVPNTTYVKDPTITFNEGSEDSYLFITVRNDLSGIAAKGEIAEEGAAPDYSKASIAYQLMQNGWAEYKEVATGKVYVYVGRPTDGTLAEGMNANGTYKQGAKALCVSTGEIKLFDHFSIADDADVSAYGAAEITIRAFAIQDSGIATVDAAWAAILQHYPYIHTGTTTGGTTGGNTGSGS